MLGRTCIPASQARLRLVLQTASMQCHWCCQFPICTTMHVAVELCRQCNALTVRTPRLAETLVGLDRRAHLPQLLPVNNLPIDSAMKNGCTVPFNLLRAVMTRLSVAVSVSRHYP